MNIYQKMSAVTSELQTVAKNLTVSTGRNNSYKAVSERDIIDAVKPVEIKHGIYSYPYDRQIIESQTLESESEYNGKITQKTTFFSRIKTTYRFVNVENPDEYIDMVTFAEGIDPQDKGSGKAMTYADKYALMKAYKISTGDDPDQNASEETHYSKVRTGNAEPPRGKQMSPRDMLAARLKELGIDSKQFAHDHGLSPKSTPEEFMRCLEELKYR
jgi:hypothetical protein